MGRRILVIIVVILIAAGIIIGVSHKSNNNPNNSSATQSAPATRNSSQQTTTNANQAPTATINIVNMLFTPSQVSIKKGETVKWTNNDNTTHTVVDDLENVGGPNSGDIAPGQSYSFTFNKSGSFQYHCRIHPSMRGTIVVK